MINLVKNINSLKYDLQLQFSSEAFAIVNNDNKVIGFIDYSVKKNTIIVDMLEILKSNRGKGYGKEIIQFLFSKHQNVNMIVGESMSSATKFWTRLNSQILSPCGNCKRNNCEKNIKKCSYGYVPNFQLDRDKFAC